MLIFLALSFLAISQCQSQAKKKSDVVVAAPSSVRLGFDTEVFIVVSGDEDLKLTVQLYDNEYLFFHNRTTFSPGDANFVKINVNASDFNPDENKSPCDANLRLVVMSVHLGFRQEFPLTVDCTGAAFHIDTDKPIYTPRQKVLITLASLDYKFQCHHLKFNVDIKNPAGVIVRRFVNLRQSNSMIPLSYRISPEPQLGDWTIEAYGLDSNGLNVTGNATFEVREYVLPRFDVRITLPGFVTVSSESFDVEVESKYSFGKDVQGTGILAFGVQFEDVYRPLFRRIHTPFTKKLVGGSATFSINVTAIVQKLPYKIFPTGGRFRATAFVQEEATGREEEATDNTLIFSQKAFLIDISRSPKYFKPGIPYHLEVLAHNPSGEPIPEAKIDLKAKINVNGQIENVLFTDNDFLQRRADVSGLADFYINIPRYTEELHIQLTAENEDPVFATLYPEESAFKDRYISIGRRRAQFPVCYDKDSVACRESFEVTSSHSDEKPDKLCYFVTCHGIIPEKQCDPVVNWPVTISIDIVPIMQPCCYLVVFYQNDTAVVADHAPIYTKEAFPNMLNVAIKHDGRGNPSFSPGQDVTFEVTGKPNSIVTLTGVDEAVYYLKKGNPSFLKPVPKAHNSCVGPYCGCLAIGGRNTLEIFRNSRLGYTTRRAAINPPEGFSEPLSAEEKSSDLEKCCQMGKAFCIADNATECNEKGRRLKELDSFTDDCQKAYVECCQQARDDGRCTPANDNLRARNSVSQSETEFAPITVFRSNFPESWQRTVYIGHRGSAIKKLTAPDSITTWKVKAFGTSPDGLFGLAKPTSFLVSKPTFLELILPYSVKKGEQFLVKAVVFSYSTQSVKAAVQLLSHDSICTSAGSGSETDSVEIEIPARSSRVALFSVVPLSVGEVKISATLRSTFVSEKVTKKVRVEPEGVEKRVSQTYAADPEVDEKQQFSVNFSLPKGYVSGSASGHLYITGNLLSPLAVVNHLHQLIQQPYGCGEQNMLRFTPNVMVLKYLIHTKQLGPRVRETAIGWIQEGYEIELNYRRTLPLAEKGSFSAFGDVDDHPGSTWLTAFVAKSFCQADFLKPFGFTVDSRVVNDSMQWLIMKQNKSSGEFKESGRIIHQEMTGAVQTSGCSLTTFSLISMLECSFKNTQIGALAVKRALNYVTKCVQRATTCRSSFFYALTGYAFCLAGEDKEARAILSKLHKCAIVDTGRDVTHWMAQSRTTGIAIETASYASLAYMCLGEYKTAEKIVNWITSERNSEGGFVSTQDTVMAIHALSIFAEKNFDRATNLTFDVTSTADGTFKETVKVISANANVRQSVEIPVGGKVNIVATGKGTALLQTGLRYNSLLTEKTCDFDIKISNDYKEKKEKMTVDICLKHLKKGPTMMAVVEVELFSGFQASTESLKDLLKFPHLGVKRFENVGRVVKLYLEEIPHSKKICLKFKADREHEVGFIQPATIRVYDYYNPDDSCTEFYSPGAESPLLDTLCFGKACVCGAGRCPACFKVKDKKKNKKSQPSFEIGKPATCRVNGKNKLLESSQKPKKITISSEELRSLSCHVTTFAYKVRVRKAETLCENGWTKITVTLIKEIKQGIRSFNFKTKSPTLTVWKRASCLCPDIKPGNVYLFIGRDGPKFVIDHNAVWIPWGSYIKRYVSLMKDRAVCELIV